MTLEYRLYLLGAVNIAAFLVFVWDKIQAKRGKRRTSEWRLLLFTMVGGELGAVCAMALARHKVSKRSFLWKFYPSFLVGAGANYAVLTI